ncbi:hypothetical protein BJ508DRAFT_305426 [Ascobolus immersus RN42]|uniref:Uncharacterized protein n=1 Tax=Ascobolus immersus RN42 TaxID=1160509 RepID=A0A3N4IEB7_ASCIM|nr:hypothetical protein BJ508DRAFT_305426 [Ascobolus immersus RN42]
MEQESINPHYALPRTPSPSNQSDDAVDVAGSVSEYTAEGLLTPTSSHFTSPTYPCSFLGRRLPHRKSFPSRRRSTSEAEPVDTETPTGRRSPTNDYMLSVRDQIATEAKRKRNGLEEDRALTEEDGSMSHDGEESEQETEVQRPISDDTKEETIRSINDEGYSSRTVEQVDDAPAPMPFGCPVCLKRFPTEKDAEKHMMDLGLLGKDGHVDELAGILGTPLHLEKLVEDTTRSSTMPKETPPEIIRNYVLFEEGDAILALFNKASAQICSYRVSSQILSMASPVLRQKGRQHNWTKPIKLHEDNPDMLLLALRMLHHQYSLLPTGFDTFQQLLDFTVIVDKYQIINSVYPPVKEWVAKWRTDNHYYWIFVAHVFGFEDDVECCVRRLSHQISDYSFDAVIDLETYDDKDTLVFLHPRLATSITDKIRGLRTRKLTALKQTLETIHFERTRKGLEICQRYNADSSFCHIVQLGQFTKTVIDLELAPDGLLWKQSLEYILGKLDGIRPMAASREHEVCVWTRKLDEVVERELGTTLQTLGTCSFPMLATVEEVKTEVVPPVEETQPSVPLDYGPGTFRKRRIQKGPVRVTALHQEPVYIPEPQPDPPASPPPTDSTPEPVEPSTSNSKKHHAP